MSRSKIKWQSGQPASNGEVYYVTGGPESRPLRFTMSSNYVCGKKVVMLYDGTDFVGRFDDSDAARKHADSLL